MILFGTIILWSALISLSSAIDYQCEPFPIATQCVIEHVVYSTDSPASFPPGHQHFRIGLSRSRKGVSSNVTAFDEVLYESMHRPLMVELTTVNMKRVVLPPALLLANFAENSIKEVQLKSDQVYNISHLDLDSNELSDIGFLAKLVNLQMVHLGSNKIQSINASTLAPLKKLQYLYLQYNEFTTIPWNSLSSSLVHLDCYWGYLESVHLNGVNLSELQYLNLENNHISTFSVHDLLQAAPNLKEVLLSQNLIDRNEMKQIKETLKTKNITHTESSFYMFCSDWDEEFIDGECVNRFEHDYPISTGKAIFLTLVTIAVGVAFALITLCVFRQMN